MYKEAKRERRIRDRLRMIAHARKVVRRYHHYSADGKIDIEHYIENDARKNHDHLKTCSCMGCGNPRHYFHGEERITMAERRAIEDEVDQLKDLE